MPPAISEDESDGLEVPDMIPARGRANAKADPEPEPEPAADEDDEDDEDDAGEDEYRVERILKHEFDKGDTVLYQIKWLGYDDEADLTWEPVENLEGAQDILNAYHKKIGGPPEPPAKSSSKKGKGKAGKRSASDAFDSPAPTSGKKRGRKSNGVAADDGEQKRELPLGSWDDDVLAVHSIVEEAVPQKTPGRAGAVTEKKELIGLLHWKDSGPKTQHKMKVLRQKVPQRLLDYYEQHLVFTPAGGDNNNMKDEDEDTKMGA